MRLFLALFAVPLIEIALFVTVGAWLGLWLTLAIVLGTAALGVAVIRRQGGQGMDELRRAARRRGDPMALLAASAMTVTAGILLILPGFLTDTLGLLLLIPPVQALLMRAVAARVRVMPAAPFGAGQRRAGPEIIDADYIDMTPPDDGTPRPPSGWTRH